MKTNFNFDLDFFKTIITILILIVILSFGTCVRTCKNSKQNDKIDNIEKHINHILDSSAVGKAEQSMIYAIERRKLVEFENDSLKFKNNKKDSLLLIYKNELSKLSKLEYFKDSVIKSSTQPK